MAEGDFYGWWEVPPYGAILVVVVGALVAVPMLVGEPGAVAESIQEVVGPAPLLLLPLLLLLLIRFLSSDRSASLSRVFSAAAGEQNTIHRVGGSPVGVGFLLLLLLFLLYYRSILMGNGGDGEDENGD